MESLKERNKGRSEDLLLSYRLEDIAIEIFEKSGYMVEKSQKREVDIVARNEKGVCYVEIKASTTVRYRNLSLIENAIKKICDIAKHNEATPVLLIFAIIEDGLREKYREDYDGLIILDLSNLLFATQGTGVQEDLVSILPFSIDQIEYFAGELDIGWIEHADKEELIIKELDNCLAGKKDAMRFEDICFRTLKYIFSEDLALWKKQQKSNRCLYRFDLLCRIKDNTEKTLWSMIEQYFNSKYIVFEFKNYSKKITQKEVYTTERYLYKKALRNVAILITKSGFDNNSLWAAKGCLRENGKLILLLSLDDLKKMYQKRREQQDPSEVLLDKVDELLMELEK